MKRIGHVYLFVRAPMIGAVKRRLAADIGDVAAWRFYRDTTRHVLRRIARDPRWKTILSVTPDRYSATGRFWPCRVERIPQGPGDLGQRMARTLKRSTNKPVIIVGSDIPGLSANHIAAAFDALRNHDMVFGPAADGGFWLVGARRSGSLGRLFENVRWSTPHSLEDCLVGLNPSRRIVFLEELEDIDDGAGFARMQLRQT